MAIKIGINGFGRIGKLVFRAAIADGGFEVVGINDLMSTKALAHMLKYDSTQGRFNGTVEAAEDGIIVNGKKIVVTAEKDPANLPWGKLGAEMVLESTGIFRDAASLKKHIAAGAKKKFQPSEKIIALETKCISQTIKNLSGSSDYLNTNELICQNFSLSHPWRRISISGVLWTS